MSPTLIAAVGVCAILVIAGIGAALRGPWLDEFWTLELSDPSKGLPALIRDGWMRDAHPPVFNAWATLLASLGITSIPAGRLVSNLLAAGLMILAAFRLSRRTPGQAGFAASLLLLTLSLPQAVESFALYRSYFWQMTRSARSCGRPPVALQIRSRRAPRPRHGAIRCCNSASTACTMSAPVRGLMARASPSRLMRGCSRWCGLATTALSSLFVSQASRRRAEMARVRSRLVDLNGLPRSA